MKRTTIFIPEPLERDIQLYARRHRKPVAWVVREALAEYLTSRPPAMLPSFTGVGRSGQKDIAERHEELLWTEPHGDSLDGSKKPVRTGARGAGRKRSR